MRWRLQDITLVTRRKVRVVGAGRYAERGARALREVNAANAAIQRGGLGGLSLGLWISSWRCS
jgi:hypothetical protein